MAGEQRSTQFQRSTSAPGIIPGTRSAYKQMVKFNAGKYATLTSGFHDMLKGIQSGANQVQQGYNTLNQQVQGQIANAAVPMEQQINQAYAQQQGATQQSLINSGLSNSTVLSSARTQDLLGYGQAMGNLATQQGALEAGYTANLGGQGLEAQMKGLGMQTQLTGGYLGDVTNFKYADWAPQTGQFSSSVGGGSSTGQETNPFMGGAAGSSGTGNIGDVGSTYNPYGDTPGPTGGQNVGFNWNMPGSGGGRPSGGSLLTVPQADSSSGYFGASPETSPGFFSD